MHLRGVFLILKTYNFRKTLNRKFICHSRNELNHALFVTFVVKNVENFARLVVHGLFLVRAFGIICVMKKPF